MGTCSSKYNKRDNNSISINSIFRRGKKDKDDKAIKSDFYFFTEWVISFRFYNKLYNDDQCTKLITMTNGPNDINIFKVIKAIDQVDGKDLSDFSNSLSLQSLKSNQSKQSKHSKQSIVAKHFDINSSNTNSITDADLKMAVIGLLEKLCRDKFKKMQKLLFIGPPNNLRWLMWISIARAKYLEIQSKIGINNEQIFNYLLNVQFPKDDDIETRINKDLPRTMINVKYFRSGNWSLSLYHVLKAIALYDDNLGYCIGMNDIAANALIVSDCNEVESFNLLRFMYSSNYGLQLRDFFINGFPKLRYYTFLVNELIKERLPNIFNIIDKNKIVPEMWLQTWLQNLYSNLFEFSVGVRLWDCIIAHGTNFLINFSLGYVKYFENRIIQCKDATDFLEIFKEKNKFKNEKEMIDFREKIIKISLNFHISEQTMNRLTKKYHQSINIEENSMETIPEEDREDNHEVEKMKYILEQINNEARKSLKHAPDENMLNHNYIPNSNNIKKIHQNKENSKVNSPHESDDSNHIPNPSIKNNGIQGQSKALKEKAKSNRKENEKNSEINNEINNKVDLRRSIKRKSKPSIILQKQQNFSIKEEDESSIIVNDDDDEEEEEEELKKLSNINMSVKEEQLPRKLETEKQTT